MGNMYVCIAFKYTLKLFVHVHHTFCIQLFFLKNCEYVIPSVDGKKSQLAKIMTFYKPVVEDSTKI